jgi:hypothetical protein
MLGLKAQVALDEYEEAARLPPDIRADALDVAGDEFKLLGRVCFF